MITWNDFEKIDMRVGTIVDLAPFPKAKRPSLQLIIDFGELGFKSSSAQITELYNKDKLVGMQVIAVVNFPPKQIANFFSECLVMGVYNENNEVILLQPNMSVKNGCRVG